MKCSKLISSIYTIPHFSTLFDVPVGLAVIVLLLLLLVFYYCLFFTTAYFKKFTLMSM